MHTTFVCHSLIDVLKNSSVCIFLRNLFRERDFLDGFRIYFFIIFLHSLLIIVTSDLWFDLF